MRLARGQYSISEVQLARILESTNATSESYCERCFNMENIDKLVEHS
jgi:hypothetical protein